MLDDKSQNEVVPHVKVTQIIVLALFSGVLVFGGVVLFTPADDRNGEMGILSLMSVGMTGISVLVSFLIPKLIVKQNRNKIASGDWAVVPSGAPIKETDAGKFSIVFQMTTIVGCTVLEGAAFFALIAYMQEGHLTTLVSTGVLMLGILLYFPTRTRIENWIEHQLRLVDEERSLSGHNYDVDHKPHR